MRVCAREQRVSSALLARAARAPDPVRVGVLVPRRVPTDHVADRWNVKPARGHVGGHEDLDAPCFEVMKYLVTLLLLLVTV